MGTQTFKKSGKTSRMSKSKGQDVERQKTGTRPGQKFDCPGAPDPLERQLMNRYRKTALGKQQYEGDDESDAMPMPYGY